MELFTDMWNMLAIGIFVFIHAVSGSPCSEASRTADLPACLAKINEALFDTDRYWFGTQYGILCPNGPTDGLQCSNHRPGEAQSIMTRLFTGSSYNPQLDRFLKLEFDSIGKNYSGCGVTYTSPATEIWRIEIDPLSTEAEEPWFLRNRPAMTWDYTEGDYFTLIVYDVGYPITHGVYVNIEGNDFSTAQVVKDYHGPLITTDLHNPYIFLLYKHDVKVNVTQDLIDVISGSAWGAAFNDLMAFIDGLNLGGPVAVNWVVATGDIYAASEMFQARILYTCPVFSTRALHDVPRPFISNTTMLTVWLDVHFSTPALSFSLCCKQYDYQAEAFNLNPIGNSIMKTARVRSEASVTFTAMKMGYYNNIHDFTGELHTLIVIDPDVPYPQAGTQERPLLHGLIINIMNGNFTNGETVRAYMGPAPPDNKPHFYYFLMYKQIDTLNATEMASYAGSSCSITIAGRCLYNINRAVSDNNLKLVGASWMRADTDEYVTKRNLDRDPSSEDSICTGRTGYDNPCPTSKSRDIIDVTVVSFLMFLAHLSRRLKVSCSPCSEASMTADLPACLAKINEALFDTDRYWFGTQYGILCPNGPTDGLQCSNHRPGEAQSIMTRLFTGSSYNPQLDRFLKLEFDSIGKNYSGCGVTYTSPATEIWRIGIDPLSTEAEEPWFLRNRPAMSWDYTEGEYFTLIVYDVGYPITHGVYVNIEGNDFSTAQVVKDYHGPLITTDLHNPYIFLLYKHDVKVNVTQDLIDVISGSAWGAAFNDLMAFIDGLNLGGPVAVNWVVATGDIYAASEMFQARILYNCPVFLTRALHDVPRPFISNTTMLTVWLDVHFSTPALSFSLCCKQYDYQAEAFNLNPIGNSIMKTARVRSEASVTFTAMKMGFYNNIHDFTGELHTLIVIDPDVPYPQAGTQERPLLHGLIINIMNGNFTNGETVRAYMGPAPPDNKPHFYYFLMYKQIDTLNATEMASYAGSSCSTTIAGRCLYNINRAVSDNNLKLVGASWMRADTDEYVTKRNLDRDPSSEDSICTVSCSPCSEASMTADLPACLAKINEALFDTDRYWFGTQYGILCPNGPADGLQCSNHRPGEAQSIMTRLFTGSSYNPQLDRFLKLEFDSIGKNYSGCGVTYTSPATEIWRIGIDPLSTEAEEPWFLRNRPAMSWDYTEGEYFTLIVYDVGYPITHGVYVNIEGNDFSTAQVVKDYHGPLITTDLHNPYIFLLYKHDVKVNVTQDLIDVISGSAWGAAFNDLMAFIDGLNLGGPVAVNWVVATGDIYAASEMFQARILYTCPVFSTRALHEVPRPFISNTTMLTVWLDVHFSTPALSFSLCCKQYDYQAEAFNLNPIGNSIMKTARVRSEASVTFTAMKMGFYNNIHNFTGEMHTLIVIDPDVPYPQAGTQERPLLHGLIINIMNGNFTNGETVRAYMGPAPPDNKPHFYYFLMYKQIDTLNATKMASYAGSSCSTTIAGRCLIYNINQAVFDNNLKLVGASWMRADTDEYVTKRNLDMDPSSEDSICAGRTGYDNPCPTSKSRDIHDVSFLSFLMFSLLVSCVR